MALAQGARRATLPGMNPECTIVVRTAADLIAVTPYLLGFHPTDSIVVIGTVGRRVSFAGRHDLPPPGSDGAGWMAPLVARQGAQAIAVLGFGPPDPVDRTLDTLGTALARSGLQIRDRLRITGGRWWSRDCAEHGCCPPEGHPVPSPSSPVAAAAVFQGQVALPDRRTLVAQVASVDGEDRRRMAAATADLGIRFGRVFRSGGDPGVLLDEAGRSAVRAGERRHAAGRSLTFPETAWLGALLAGRPVFDYAVDRISGEPWRITQWAEMTRRVETPFVPGPAALLGYAAWRAGLGPLARVAVDRALRLDPGHQFARVLDGLLAAGIGHEAVEDFVSPTATLRGRSR
ncbi:DUF4192 domain-containing protein [Paractinoplanes maris]|uniref:DUF4192 domain-containing protein n=1 Tax=Paractinoplanes maris TaxID=1734446 RepID=UPI00201FCBE9|nr:DUF4192 domain-containing protein [Actinoplanes maris]